METILGCISAIQGFSCFPSCLFHSWLFPLQGPQPSGSIWREKSQATPEGNFQNFPRGFDSSLERSILSSFSFLHSRRPGLFPHSACFSLNSISVFMVSVTQSFFVFLFFLHSFIRASCPLPHSLPIFPRVVAVTNFMHVPSPPFACTRTISE